MKSTLPAVADRGGNWASLSVALHFKNTHMLIKRADIVILL